MANLLSIVKLPRLGGDWIKNPSLVTRYWNTAMSTIESFINGINTAFNTANQAQEAADQAQSSANQAQDSADTAQGSANTAQDTADSALSALATKLDKPTADGLYVHQTTSSSWGSPSGTASRASLASYPSPAVAATYTQAQVQAMADEIALLSQVLVGLITDLKSNKSI